MKTDIADLIGTKFLIHGRSQKQGFDCYGLAIEVSKMFGHTLPDLWYDNTKKETFNDNAITIIKQLSNIVELTDEQNEGNLIVFFEQGRMVHIGVILDQDLFIHCDRLGVRILQLSTYFRKEWQIYRWN